jgi:hypothetical protein
MPWRVRLFAALATASFVGTAADWPEPRDVLTDVPIGKIEAIDARWQPNACEGSGRKEIPCAVAAYLACDSFFRTDLCERVGIYPTLIPRQDYRLYGRRVVEWDWVAPDFEQYRIVEVRNLDERYWPPLWIVHLEVRDCWRMKRPPSCSGWGMLYQIIWNTDTLVSDVVAAGVVSSAP